MKKVFTLLTAVVVATTTFAQQPPNAGFESWAANGNNPTSWSTIETAAAAAGPLGSLAISGKKFTYKETAVGNFVEGTTSAAVRSDSVVVTGFGAFLIPGLLYLGKVSVDIGSGGLVQEAYAFTGKPDLIKFAYKYEPVGVDTANFFFAVSKYDTSTKYLGTVGESLFSTNGNWDTVTAPLDYDPMYAGLSPDSIRGGFFSSGREGRIGSKLWIDNVRFVYNNPSGVVEVPVTTPTVGVYPNPANSVVNFKAEEDLNNATATIYSLEGKLVVSKTISNNIAEVNELAAGRYFFTIHRDGKAIGVGNFSLVK